MKAGYIYVLSHPSDPNLYKVGMTTLSPEKRLFQHNSDFNKPAGRVVQETGQKWELKEFHKVVDPQFAEKVFWDSIRIPEIPFQSRVEIERMPWKDVQAALRLALEAGERPKPTPDSLKQPDYVYANSARIRRRLEGRKITLLTYVKSLQSGKADFRCGNGHVWREVPDVVGTGAGCPVCGVGQTERDVIESHVKPGYVFLLTNADRQGYVKIGIKLGSLDECFNDWPWESWDMHRYRYSEELKLAEKTIWDLLGKPLPHDRDEIRIDLESAENAFKKLTYEIREQVAENERKLERDGEINQLKPLGRRPPQ